MKKYKINEIFYSIQGEGYHTGTPAVFIRFAGCNLKCDFCDTDHADVKKELSAADILAEIQMYPSPIVILTGGEPTMQIDEALIKALKMQGLKVHVETNGTIAIPYLVDWITLSPKYYQTKFFAKEYFSKECEKKHLINELKVIYDGDVGLTTFLGGCFTADHYYLQPMSGKNTAEVIKFIKANPSWKLSLQTHKLLNIR